MSITLKEWLQVFAAFLVAGIIIGLFFVMLPYDIGYKRGPIDAALGKQHYYLQKRDDSTVVWTKCIRFGAEEAK